VFSPLLSYGEDLIYVPLLGSGAGGGGGPERDENTEVFIESRD